MSAGGASGGGGNPLGIYQALLDFATRIGADDAVNQRPSNFQQMSDADRQFLVSAMTDMVKDSDPTLQMKKHLEVLTNINYSSPSETDLEKAIDALEQLMDLCGNLDVASDFHKIGGFRVLLPLLASSSPELRSHGAELIGELAQNHTYCQNALKQAGIVRLLLEMLDTDTNDVVRTKALYGISCMIRSNEECEEEFMNLKGLEYLSRALDSQCQRLYVKAAFLLSTLLQKPSMKRAAIEIGFSRQLALCLLRQSDPNATEQIAAALLALVENCSEAADDLRKPDLDFETFLRNRLNSLMEDPSRAEQINQFQRLLKICNFT